MRPRNCLQLLLLPLLFLPRCTLSAAAQTLSSPVGETPSAVNQPQTSERDRIAAAMKLSREHQDAQALEILNGVLAQDPGNETANLLAAGAAIEELQMEPALRYAQKAQQADPTDWKPHLSILVADAGMGRLKERDHERELLRAFHSDGKHPDAASSGGFMVDYFPVGENRVRAIEYFAPAGKDHFSYRFLVYNRLRAQILSIALESDDLDQASWAGAHPQLAAAGQREYSLDGYGPDSHTTYRSFSDKPTYDEVKAEVIRILNQQASTLSPSGSKLP